eukprot:jgi/Phyca11/119349/e_gw1.38.108.1
MLNATKKSRTKQRKPKKKIRTYYRRKAEIKTLMAEMAALEQQKEMYKKRVEVLREREELIQREATNQALRKVLHAQRLAFASSLSMISQILRAGDHSRYEPVIRLGTDPRARYNTLLAMKQPRLQEAVYFLAERSCYMAMDTEFTDLQRFQSDNGDMCLVCFDIKPLPKAQSVRQAFEGVLKFSYNLEISISDLIGDITVRENDDEDWDSSVAQHRLVTSIPPDVKVDTNSVTFTHYWGDGSGPQTHRAVGDEVGVAVCNYVEEDELYPYHVSERVRHDITFHVMVAKYPRRRPDLSSSATATGSRNYETQDDLVVATRWTCLRVRKPQFPLDDDVAGHIRHGMEEVVQSMFTATRQSVNSHVSLR